MTILAEIYSAIRYASNIACLSEDRQVGIDWGAPVDGIYGVFRLEDAVTVTNDAGAVVLDEPGEGGNLDEPDISPGTVTGWSDDRAVQALATVTINWNYGLGPERPECILATRPDIQQLDPAIDATVRILRVAQLLLAEPDGGEHAWIDQECLDQHFHDRFGPPFAEVEIVFA